ncbi:MAG TPA: aminotransferase class V-fold PLP-dependent enzyme, partial [Acidimicrobiales bacterium]|nr:aminotransferase class V-fold PLP-dependent enzyme [Acidimicrobiales bacterium]
MTPRYPLEPDAAGMDELGRAVVTRAIAFVEALPDRPASPMGAAPAAGTELIREMLAPPPERPGQLVDLLARVDRAAAHAVETAGPGYLAYIPGGGVFASAVAEFYAEVTNRMVGLARLAPGLAALERSVVGWLGDVSGMPSLESGGLLLSGGSMANFTAVVAARHARLGENDQISDGTLYVSSHAHHSLLKAARLAGLPAANVRTVPCTTDLRMNADAAHDMIVADRASGRRPFLLVGSAGTTSTGTIDPLPELAGLAKAHELWFHVDGAYGGLFRLTDRGRARLQGTEQADSVTLDPHKSLFLPYGTGALVVRDANSLRAAHTVVSQYLQDARTDDALTDFADLGLELSREFRGLRVWLPLHLYGVAVFRAALDEKLDLARLAYDRLAAEPRLEVPWEPDLTVVAFRCRPSDPGLTAAADADRASHELLDRINATGRVVLSSTVVDD